MISRNRRRLHFQSDEGCVAAAGRGLDIPLAPPVMPLHYKAPLRFAFPFRNITYTRTGGFCWRKLLSFLSGRTQNPPVLWLTESACSCPEQPLSATHGRQRYNTLDFANKVVCHETAGFIGFFPPRQRRRLWKPLPRERCPLCIHKPTGRSHPYWRRKSQRNRRPFGFPARFERSTQKRKMVYGYSFQNAKIPSVFL